MTRGLPHIGLEPTPASVRSGLGLPLPASSTYTVIAGLLDKPYSYGLSRECA